MNILCALQEIKYNGFIQKFKELYGSDENVLEYQKQRYVDAVTKFGKYFPHREDVRIFSASGRTEIGGNHTDHQHGCVLAAAVNLEELCKAIGIKRVRVVDPYNLAETEAAIKEELAIEEPSVIISRRPCALLKYVQHKPALKVDADKCKSCKMCMKLGCPAISMKDGKAVIDHTQCVGCGICQEMCKFDAIG